MKLLNTLERRFGKYAIENVTPYLLVAQGFTFFLGIVKPQIVQGMMLDHDAVFHGEWWRLFSFMIMPPVTYPIFLIFFLAIYYMIGTVLETQWGTFRYNVYLLTGYLATLLVVLIPGADVTNLYVMESIFLAFAWLYPDYEFLILFIFPCKVKWLGLVGWIMLLIQFLTGDWAIKAAVVAGTINFFLFFQADLLQRMRTSRRKFKGDMERARERSDVGPMHVCAACGVTDLTDKKMEFRYCPQCTGTPAYCIDHIQKHQHR